MSEITDKGSQGRKFLTPFGIVVVDLLVTLTRAGEDGVETNLISDFITELQVGYNIFNYANSGYIKYADKGSHLFGNEKVPLKDVFELKIKIDTLQIEETYIASGIKYNKMDTGSSDSILEINFISNTSKRIAEIKNIKTQIDKNLPVGTFLKNILERYDLKTGIWKQGVTAFSTTQFINSNMADVIEDMKLIDRRRDVASLFTLFADFKGKLHYVEISDLIKTMGSASKKIYISSFGHEYGMGLYTAPNVIQSFKYNSSDIYKVIANGSGIKMFAFNTDTKIISPIPSESGIKAKELYNSLPQMNSGKKAIDPSIFADENVTEYTMNYVTDDDKEQAEQIAMNIASRPNVFLNYFQNNSASVRLGFVNPEIEIVNKDGSIKNGITVVRVNEEPVRNGIEENWMIAGIKHTMNGTQFYTDLDLIRAGT